MKNLLFHIVLRQVMLVAGLCSFTVLLQAQTGTDFLMAKYLFPDFSDCVIKLKNGATDN